MGCLSFLDFQLWRGVSAWGCRHYRFAEIPRRCATRNDTCGNFAAYSKLPMSFSTSSRISPDFTSPESNLRATLQRRINSADSSPIYRAPLCSPAI
jgi:hypothetical protein